MTSAKNIGVLVLGAGAAGLLCAIEAGKRGRRVILLERADRVGKKILISGGGRCNFTNLHTRPDNFLSANPHFAKSALARYTPADFIALAERHRIRYHEKTLGQLFCDGSSQQIVAMLLTEAAQANVNIVLEAKVQEVRRSLSGFEVQTNTATYSTANLVVATGGLSIPKMGATSFGYDLARQFNIPIREPRPALVPLTLGGADLTTFADLTGVSAEVIASLGKRRFREKLLFTHRGLSGPAILQISSYWTDSATGAAAATDPDLNSSPSPAPILIDWAPNHDLLAALREPNARRDLAPPNPPSDSGSPPVSPIVFSTRPNHPAGPTTPSTNSSAAFTPGPSTQPAPKASTKPKSPRAASTPMPSPHKPWNVAVSPASTASAKSSTSPAT